jgi:hypothetical protein
LALNSNKPFFFKFHLFDEVLQFIFFSMSVSVIFPSGKLNSYFFESLNLWFLVQFSGILAHWKSNFQLDCFVSSLFGFVFLLSNISTVFISSKIRVVSRKFDYTITSKKWISDPILSMKYRSWETTKRHPGSKRKLSKTFSVTISKSLSAHPESRSSDSESKPYTNTNVSIHHRSIDLQNHIVFFASNKKRSNNCEAEINFPFINGMNSPYSLMTSITRCPGFGLIPL